MGDPRGGSTAITVRSTMTLTREEFLRTLARVLDGTPYWVDDEHVTVAPCAGRTLRITLQSAPEHRLGALRLPRLQVEMCFGGYSDGAREAFLERFRRGFQRGGG